ncbi:type VI secretion system baseplate subunit TssE [Pasteurella atlantica]|uniref:Type VI secretion system baseplate subunit TssE n=2 Tax=Pasteurellaceae TaxID=712 RepID=A0ACC6HPC3_9PAST|nr:type VI secretion system baseplate subunit TssE [Pasteurella atlantica]MDP8052622.1 type VI secretion system baseplate subunit TssE [Pasteurella atlantica]MDP8105778.1 type VI secretion system baseplate subunit TssE [Pasteurella atlantica]MDP8149280.1 type VI secretion system baseplate subunit TssE [Pasteurella atlantica]
MTFFNRIVATNESNEIYKKSPEERSYELLHSIKQNLEVILNSRRGCTGCSPQFGLRDFNDATSSSQSLCVEIISDIKNNIELFEPRVKVNRIDYVQDEMCPDMLIFRLVCAVILKNKIKLSEFDLVLNSITQKFSIT